MSRPIMADAYYACMDEADGRQAAYDGRRRVMAPPPATAIVRRRRRSITAIPMPYPYYPYYYGPSVSFGFGFGGYGGHGLAAAGSMAAVSMAAAAITAKRSLTLLLRTAGTVWSGRFLCPGSPCRPKPIPPSSIRCSCRP